jgi:N-acetylglucosaminyldiphosphoundecaprenol N-acetyl-beta-D-mannosaminyltransferase
MKTIGILGFTLFSDDLSVIPIDTNNCRVLNTMSPNSYGITTKDDDFKKALKNCDFLVLDGVYFALASILLLGKNIKRNQGPDVFYHFMNRINNQKGKVFFLGSTENTLQKIKNKAKIEYPNITTKSYSPPFKPVFSNEENEMMISKINDFQPDLLFVGMTCPKQEKWATNNREKVNASLVCSIGAVFDWYAGNQPEINQLWWRLRLGWVKRIIDRPEVLKRNLPNVAIFGYHLLLSVFGKHKY